MSERSNWSILFWWALGLVWGWCAAKEYYHGGIFTAFWKGLTGQ